MNTQHLPQILERFNINTQDVAFKPITAGYINDTFLVLKSDTPVYILQRINHNVFKNVSQLLKNIDQALLKLQADDYSTIKLLKADNGESYCNHENSYWRLMTFINDSTTHNTTTDPKIAYEAGRIIGRFHNLLQFESPEAFVETIPDFNNLPFRITEFNTAFKSTSEDRKKQAKDDIEFVTQSLSKLTAFYNSELPLRVCHNDTKLNNILFSKSNEALCLIDLDTIMSGYFHYDFGDAVRTIVNTANEDEQDLSKITFNKPLFEAFVNGLDSNDSFLNNEEIKLLPIAAALMPFMHGLRALTDFLNGNIYYKVTYENQNLDRCKSLFHFTKLVLNHETYMEDIIDKTLKKRN